MRFKSLRIYDEAMSLLSDIYKLTKLLPKDEIYNLTSQMNRAALSIPSNIAEGSGKDSKTDFARYISIAYGSCSELYCQLEAVTMLYPHLKENCEILMRKLFSLSESMKKFKVTLKSNTK